MVNLRPSIGNGQFRATPWLPQPASCHGPQNWAQSPNRVDATAPALTIGPNWDLTPILLPPVFSLASVGTARGLRQAQPEREPLKSVPLGPSPISCTDGFFAQTDGRKFGSDPKSPGPAHTLTTAKKALSREHGQELADQPGSRFSPEKAMTGAWSLTSQVFAYHAKNSNIKSHSPRGRDSYKFK